MGESFLRAKNEKFRRQRDDRWAQERGRDLFDRCPPELRYEFMAEMTPDAELHAGDELWARVSADDQRVRLYQGAQLVAQANGPTASHLLQRGIMAIARVQEANYGYVSVICAFRESAES